MLRKIPFQTLLKFIHIFLCLIQGPPVHGQCGVDYRTSENYPIDSGLKPFVVELKFSKQGKNLLILWIPVDVYKQKPKNGKYYLSQMIIFQEIIPTQIIYTLVWVQFYPLVMYLLLQFVFVIRTPSLLLICLVIIVKKKRGCVSINLAYNQFKI